MDPLDRLTRIDLNLVVSLYVLLDERNVTRAAERLFITQPAASRTLTRLRRLFDDPLLTRSGSEMVMTPRAQQLKDQLPAVLDVVGSLVAPVAFDPAEHEQTFQLAVPEVFAQALVGELMQELRSQAPGITLTFRDPDRNAFDALLSGEIDFLLKRATEDAMPAAVHQESVLRTHGMVLARRDHKLAGKPRLSLKQILEYPWIDCFPHHEPGPSGPLDRLLQKSGLERRISIQCTHLLTALRAVAATDSLIYLAHITNHPGAIADELALLALPRELNTKNLGLNLLQHRRTLASEPHIWMKEKLIRLLSDGG